MKSFEVLTRFQIKLQLLVDVVVVVAVHTTVRTRYLEKHEVSDLRNAYAAQNLKKPKSQSDESTSRAARFWIFIAANMDRRIVIRKMTRGQRVDWDDRRSTPDIHHLMRCNDDDDDSLSSPLVCAVPIHFCFHFIV